MEFKVHDKNTAPEGSKALLAKAEQAIGMVPNLLGMLAESPLALNAYMTLDGLRRESALTRAEQQLVLLAISVDNRCTYCVAAHTGLARQDKLPDEAIEALRAGKPVPGEKLEALRRFVLVLKEKQGWVGDSELADFTAAGFERQHVLDVITLLAMKTISNFANHIAQTPLDEAFAPARWEPPV